MPIADVIAAIKDHQKRAPDYSLYVDYDEGRHRYPFASDAFKRDYMWVLEHARENMCPAVIHSFTDLIRIDAWAGTNVKRAAEVDEQVKVRRTVNLAAREAHRAGDGYVLAWPDSKGVWRPWYHQATQVAYKTADDDPDTFEWVAKIWVTPGNVGRVNVYYKATVERWATTGKVRHDDKTAPTWPTNENAWAEHSDADGASVLEHDRGRVPWVHLAQNPTAQGGRGRSVLHDVIPLQDALNKSLADLIVGGESFARPLRALMNYDPKPQLNPATGKYEAPVLRYDPTRQSILGIHGPGPLQQLDPPDATKLIAVQEAFVNKIGRVAGIPPTDIMPEIGNVPSGAALRLLSNRRTNAVRDFHDDNTHAITDLMELLGVPDVYPEWADPAPMDDTERLEIAQQRVDLGYPFEEVLPALGEDPEDIKRIMGKIRDERASIGRAAAAAFRRGDDPAATLRG